MRLNYSRPSLLISVALALSICAHGIRTSARAGISRLMSESAMAVNSLPAADQSVQISTDDPEAHYARAMQLRNLERHVDAVAELQHALSRRPADYFLWEALAQESEDAGNNTEALEALRKSISLAPFYSEPHWRLGNLLLREGQSNEAFDEMRRSLDTDPALYGQTLALAWVVYDGHVNAMPRAVFPHRPVEYAPFAHMLVMHDQIESAMSLLRGAHQFLSPDNRRMLIDALIEAGRFEEAHELWTTSDFNSRHDAILFDGGFEHLIEPDSERFGWQMMAGPTVRVLPSSDSPYAGQRNLRIEYSGNLDPAAAIVSQIIPITSSSRYRLTFAARTRELVSAALPIVVVTETSKDGQVLGRSTPLPAGTSGWHLFNVDFETASATRAVTVSVQRARCNVQPCPIFGSAQFDEFSMLSSVQNK
jgi:tetratricopeptide (TPR) repeat protein